MYTKTLYAGWADMDFNSHMKNTSYLARPRTFVRCF